MYRKSPSLSNAWCPDFAEGRPVGCRWFHLGRRARFSAFVAGYISWFDELIWSLLVQHLFWPSLTMYQDLPQRLFSKLRSSLKHLCIYIKLLFLNSYHKAKFSVFESSDIEIKKKLNLIWMKSLSDSCERIIIVWLSPLVFVAFCSWSASRNSQPTSFYQSAFFRAKTSQCPVPLQRKALGRDWAQSSNLISSAMSVSSFQRGN